MDSSCGIGIFRPQWLRKFATVRSFMAIYGLLGTVQAMAFVYLVVTLTTMEKRFKIPSKSTGIMLTGNEISQILLSLFLSYHGGHRNRPRWIAWGVAFSALSCFVVALPHLIYGPGVDALELTEEYMVAEMKSILDKNITDATPDRLCSEKGRADDCETQELTGDFSVVPLVLVFLSQFILGVGNTLYFSLGQTYLDDNTKKTETPVLLGWTLALRTLGPAIGFVLAYICLNIYIDPSKVPMVDKKDPRWLGAWWLGWIFLGTIMFIFALLMAMFPQHLPPPDAKQKAEEECLAANGVQNSVLLQIKSPEIPRFKDFPVALKRLLKNKLLMFNNLSGIFYILGASGYITYIAKYLEVQFQESATYTVITGPVMIVGMVGGFLISGYVITKFKPGPKWLLGWNVLIGFIFLFGQFIFMQIDCPIKEVHSFSGDPKRFQLVDTCNLDCSCDYVKYSPVCEVERKITYFSPCHAGCKSMLDDKKQVFTNCSCTNEDYRLLDGPCLTDCSQSFFTFVVISFLINFIGSSGRIGNLLVNYRSVDIKDKSFAQGLALWMISLLALIPSPILYGIIIDSTCLVWNVSCGKRGNCYTYDKRKMRIYLNSTAIILTAFGVAFDAVVWYQGRKLNLYENISLIQDKELSASIIKSDKKAPDNTDRNKNTNNLLS